MKNLTALHNKLFTEVSQYNIGSVPLKAKHPSPPIMPANKWNVSFEKLQKEYNFRRANDRNIFIEAIFEHEELTKHYATILCEQNKVIVTLQTKDINQVTQIDKEFAKYCDEIYHDVCYLPDELMNLQLDVNYNGIK